MKIMFVEDDELMQRMYLRTLQQTGMEVVGINNGSLALETADREKPDIILMDAMMPVMNGIDALKLLKANDSTKSIPVIILSAYEDDALLLSAMNAGASRYLVKSSIEPEEVIKIIQEVAAPAK